ncbi:MAG: CapA family protein [Methylococcaceae bacterium]|nr:CapA family protein [Methylococcaceae bacterium]
MRRYSMAVLGVLCCANFLTYGSEALITLNGSVSNESGLPLGNVQLRIANREVLSDALGKFTIPALERNNDLLYVSALGYDIEIIPVHLLKSAQTNLALLEPIVLTVEQPTQVNFLFGGDTSFGRRFIDSKEITPRDQVPLNDENALISVNNPIPGSQEVSRFIRPLYQNADWGVLNLETPLTHNPSTPHESKAFAFFTLPESAQALTWLGVNYVSLGNNHLYDYLEQGVLDTLMNLDAIGIFHSGAGMNSTKALAPYRTAIKGYPWSFLSMTSVSGSQHELNYVADDNKAGAANLLDREAVAKVIKQEVEAGYITIAQLHGGKEYTFEPSAQYMKDIKFAVDAGAKLIIGHHPHVAQGVGMMQGIVTIHSLGNLVFDQARLETMLGLMAKIKMLGDQVESVRLVPIYIDNFIPKMVSGDLANRFLRRIGEFSTDYNGLVYPYNNQAWVAFSYDQTVVIDASITETVTIPESGVVIMDLRQLIPSESSLRSINSLGQQLKIRLGRDVMLHGDFEDWDIDQDGLVANRWDTSKLSSKICTENPYHGVASLCSTRKSNQVSDSVISFRNRIRVMGESTGNPNKSLSLMGYMRGENAGSLNIISRFYASAGTKTFGEEVSVTNQGGTFDWQPFFADLNMPEDGTPDDNFVGPINNEDTEGSDDDIDNFDVENNPRAVRFFLRHSPPIEGQALLSFDDLALINWEEAVDSGQAISTPHARDFLRIEGRPGRYTVQLNHQYYRPRGSYQVNPLLQVNGQQGSVMIKDSDFIDLKLSLQQKLPDSARFEWWVSAKTPSGQHYSYVYPSGWQTGEEMTIASPLLNISEFNLFQGHLPANKYIIEFCLDNHIDAIKQCHWLNQLQLEVQ